MRQRCARYSLQKNLCIAQDWSLQPYHDAKDLLQTQVTALRQVSLLRPISGEKDLQKHFSTGDLLPYPQACSLKRQPQRAMVDFAPQPCRPCKTCLFRAGSSIQSQDEGEQ